MMPLFSKLKGLVVHLKRERQRQTATETHRDRETDNFTGGSTNFKGGPFFHKEAEVKKMSNLLFMHSFLFYANDE